jgi:hyaluronan synthase
MVFAVGWLFFKSRARGRIGNDLVSVIIPIYNQEALIEEVIDAIFRSTYKNLEVVAVNDGSKDGTKEVLDYLRTIHPQLNVIHKKNGGKRTAVATGFYASKGRFLILIDSDSIIEENAIEEFMKTFNANPKVGGVVGNGKVWNANKNLLTKCQDAWYDYAFNIHKTTESFFGAVLCCSGCMAGYRKEAIAEYIPYWASSSTQFSDDRFLTSYAIATPWAKKEFTAISERLKESMSKYDDSEDRGLTSHTLTEWETAYVPTAIVHTEVPETFRRFLKQQIRWKKGYIRTNFFVSAFFWRKNPLMSTIFYLEFMNSLTAPLIFFIVYLYMPFILNNPWLTLSYFLGNLLIGVTAAADYRFRDCKAKFWIYKPIMVMITTNINLWLLFPALWTFRKNLWFTR